MAEKKIQFEGDTGQVPWIKCPTCGERNYWPVYLPSGRRFKVQVGRKALK